LKQDGAVGSIFQGLRPLREHGQPHARVPLKPSNQDKVVARFAGYQCRGRGSEEDVGLPIAFANRECILSSVWENNLELDSRAGNRFESCSFRDRRCKSIRRCWEMDRNCDVPRRNKVTGY
jgi:hypothetical protein